MYLGCAKIIKDYRCFQVGRQFPFRDINLLVGDQGCGKSTFLEGIFQHKDFMSVTTTERLNGKTVESFFFDSEKMNPRITNPLHYTNVDGTSHGIGVGSAIKSRFGSHGETMVAFTVDALRKANKCVLFLDEPESGLSLKNQYLLWSEIEKASQRNCQIFVATHSLVLIEAAEEVLSLEHGRWMKSEEFVKLNKATC